MTSGLDAAPAQLPPHSLEAALARTARAEVEAELDRAGWPWSRAVSLHLDGLVILEERDR